MKLSNIYLHGSVTNPELLADLMLSTGLVAVQSTREKNKILMVTPEDALIKEALKDIAWDSEKVLATEKKS